MKIKLNNKEFENAFKELMIDFPFSISDEGIDLVLVKSELNKLEKNDEKIIIHYNSLPNLFFLFSEAISCKSDINKDYFEKLELTYMADCSRNAVMKVETAKKLIRHLAVSGYDSFMLYLEDTYVVKEYPYFGYLRNGYTKEDIKEIDEYCHIFGIELIPCIQSLAHFNAIVRYPSMEKLFDCNDILLCENDEVYKFIDTLIKTCREYFSSRRIHIGMDEAHMIGRGRYMDEHGYVNRFEIMSKHVEKVVDICRKYDFTAMMWADMYYPLAASKKKDKEYKTQIAKIPQEVKLVYWDYYSADMKHFMDIMKTYKQLPNEILFAGGAYKWHGFTPDNRFSFKEIEANLKASIKSNISQYILTAWGDNGAEASQFSILPSIYYAGRCKYGLFNLNNEYKSKFEVLFGIKFSDFIKIDLGNRISRNNDINERNTANKYLLFNDPLLGTLDTIITDEQSELYKEHYLSLKKTNKKANKWSYILKTQEDLCNVLTYKSTIGLRLRKDYQEKNIDNLKQDLVDLKKIKKLLQKFYESFLTQWNIENRNNGFDVQDIRFGALYQRLDVAIRKVSEFLNDNSKEIPELNEKLLCFMGHESDFEKDLDQCEYRWRRMTSVNVND